jgi:hypothetical protein
MCLPRQRSLESTSADHANVKPRHSAQARLNMLRTHAGKAYDRDCRLRASHGGKQAQRAPWRPWPPPGAALGIDRWSFSKHAECVALVRTGGALCVLSVTDAFGLFKASIALQFRAERAGPPRAAVEPLLRFTDSCSVRQDDRVSSKLSAVVHCIA